MRFPRIIATFVALTLLAAACGDDGDDNNTISLGDNGLTPSIDDIQVEVRDGSTRGLAFATFDNEQVGLEQYLGGPLVINFFAQWCVNCVQEMPAFERISQEFAAEVTFLGISIDEDPADALELVDQTGVTYDVGWDPSEELFAHFQGLSMPTTVFVDADGNVERVWSGVLNDDSLRDRITEDLL
ncbi:MAG: hypothetical protein DHS20C19_01360 [Acidimicrobiales bacterium]|nr:MAG: hypothetical protein DHS20C19_01360 [Acidimicrobiales bacterium]